MNTAETNIYINPVTQPGVLAPITLIGGGEVRVNRAVNSTTAAWDDVDQTGSLSFGYDTVAGSKVITRTVRVRNYVLALAPTRLRLRSVTRTTRRAERSQ